jgi:CheY-like chemotaxis protein
MRGTCIDITELVLAEQERERSVTRFRSLVESCPDAILVFGPDGRVVQANGQAAELFGGDPVGHSVESFWAADARDGLRGIPATGVDGRALQLDVTLAHLDQADAADLVAAFVHNAAPRLASEALAATVREAQVRLRQALEINDNVVQGLTAAAEHLAQGDSASTASYLDATMASARRMMIDLLDPLNGGEVQAGDLVRAAPSSLDGPTRRVVAPPASPDASSKIRVLIVDDYEDMRALLRATLESKGGYEIVGEAADGEEAVRLADALQPDVVVLDLAMPRMDGLQALPLICDSVAGVRVIVLSGFDEAIVAKQALSAGAARFIEKGPRMNLAAAISDVMQAR